VLHALLPYGARPVSDTAALALYLFDGWRDNLPQVMREAIGGKNLLKVGLAQDIDFCARLDVFNVVGIVKQGFGHYMKNSLIPPGVPAFLLVLVVPIEFISTFIVRPFSLMVRLFANMLAGHLILVTFAALTAALWAAKITVIIAPFSFALLVAMTGFEILVSFLQAFIFTILTAVYIGGAMHPEH